MRTKLIVTDVQPIETLIAAIEDTSEVRVTGYVVHDTYVEFEIEAVEKLDPYRDLGFTHDFSFNGIGAYRHKQYPRVRRRIGR